MHLDWLAIIQITPSQLEGFYTWETPASDGIEMACFHGCAI